MFAMVCVLINTSVRRAFGQDIAFLKVRLFNELRSDAVHGQKLKVCPYRHRTLLWTRLT